MFHGPSISLTKELEDNIVEEKRNNKVDRAVLKKQNLTGIFLRLKRCQRMGEERNSRSSDGTVLGSWGFPLRKLATKGQWNWMWDLTKGYGEGHYTGSLELSSLEDPPLTPSLPLAEFISSLFSPLPVAFQEGETVSYVIRFCSKCPSMIPAFCHSHLSVVTHTHYAGLVCGNRIADMKDCDLQD